MEHITDNDHHDEDDALSLRDLQMYDQTPTSSTRSSPRTSSAQDLFEFFPILSNNPTATGNNIIFCGKLIPADSITGRDNEEMNDQYQNRQSFRLPELPMENKSPLRSVSNRDFGRRVKFSTSKSKGKGFMLFGPVKFMPEMEMRSIRERQARRAPSLMFPVAGGKAVAVTVAQKSRVSCRARLNSLFEKSLACIRN